MPSLEGQNSLSSQGETLKGAKMTIFETKLHIWPFRTPLNAIFHVNFIPLPQEGNTMTC